MGLGTLLVSSAQDAVPRSEGQQETRTQGRWPQDTCRRL